MSRFARREVIGAMFASAIAVQGALSAPPTNSDTKPTLEGKMPAPVKRIRVNFVLGTQAKNAK